jgi:hypothetical protein
MAKPSSITWIVRFVEKGVLQVRGFQTEQAARLFMQRTVDAGSEVRSWAEVRTHEREVPTVPRKA